MSSPPPPEHASQLRAADLELVRRARTGDPRAVEELIGRLACVSPILRERHRRLGAPLRPDELEDVRQDTLVALWQKLGEYRGLASLETWVYRFAQNELLRALEQRRRTARLGTPAGDGVLDGHADPSGVGPGGGEFDAARLHAALEQLGPPASDAIRARHFEQLSFEQIAAGSGEPLSTVKARYYRGLLELRRLIEPWWREESR